MQMQLILRGRKVKSAAQMTHQLVKGGSISSFTLLVCPPFFHAPKVFPDAAVQSTLHLLDQILSLMRIRKQNSKVRNVLIGWNAIQVTRRHGQNIIKHEKALVLVSNGNKPFSFFTGNPINKGTKHIGRARNRKMSNGCATSVAMLKGVAI